MKTVTSVVKAEAGLHARPASLLVKKAGEFKSTVKIQKGEKSADAKRLLSILTLGAKQGDAVTITVDGEDEDQAIVAIQAIVEADC